MARDDITPAQAAAILENGKPYGVGGKTIQIIGLSEPSDAPLYRQVKRGRGGWVGDEAHLIDLSPVSELTGGLDGHEIQSLQSRAFSSAQEDRCFTADGATSPVKIITANFNKGKLETIRDKEAGASVAN